MQYGHNINDSQNHRPLKVYQSAASSPQNNFGPLDEVTSLDEALQLAAKLHYGALQGSDEQLCSVIENVKRIAIKELDRGDGRKVESVRVERKLDGSVSIFFGI